MATYVSEETNQPLTITCRFYQRPGHSGCSPDPTAVALRGQWAGGDPDVDPQWIPVCAGHDERWAADPDTGQVMPPQYRLPRFALSPRETCKHCGRAIEQINGRWIDPEAMGDDSIWRETCDGHDTFQAEHEPMDHVTSTFDLEIIHSRDPDSSCAVSVWTSGSRVPDERIYLADLDPGASSPPLSEWDEATDEVEKDERLTPGFREALVDERNSFRDSSWIDHSE